MAQSLPGERGILKALESPATCTTETLLSIKSILLPAVPGADGRNEKENVRGGLGHARAKSLVSTTKVTAKTTGGTKAHTRQLTVVEVKQEVILTEAEKVNLAFQIVNACIKSLSQLAKEHVLTRRGGEALASGVKTTITTKTIPPGTALRPKSPNARRIKSIDEVCRAPTKRAPTPAATTAACACVALAHLQAHYKVSDGKDSAYQVENGTLAVIAKCVDLELAELAMQQLQTLKLRLLEHLGCVVKSTSSSKEAPDVYWELLSFPIGVRGSPILQFAAKVHQHGWQLALLQADSATIEILASSDHVRCELLKAYIIAIQDATRATRQLMAMSRLLLQLSAQQGISVDAVLHLRCSAYSLQIAAPVPGLSDDDMRSICVKVAKCLDVVSKGSRSGKGDRSGIVKATIDPLLEGLDTRPACADDVALLRRMLKRTANARGESSPSLSNTSAEDQSSTIEIIRLVAERLGSSQSGAGMEQAIHALQKPLPEDKSTADRLLVEVVGLRRSVHKAVSERLLSGVQSFPLATACISFLRQFLGISKHDQTCDASTIQDRLHLGKKFVKPFISTLVVCCLHHESPVLELFSALKECNDMFLAIVQLDSTFANERFSDKKQPGTSIFVTISKLCHKIWNSQVNVHGVADEVAIAALEASIGVMGAWTTAEKEVIAYSQKLRYLMDAHLAREEWQSAHSTFVRLLEECRESGYFAEMAEKSATASSHQLREKASVGHLLFRCLQSFVTISVKSSLDKASILHTKLELDAVTQGLLLEWQLEHLSTYISQHRTTDHSCVPLIELTRDELFKLYSKKAFPVRRLRVGVVIARLLSTVPHLCQPDDLLSDISIPPRTKIPGPDAGLSSNAAHLQATLQATLALLDPHGDQTLGLLKNSLETYEATCSSMTRQADMLKSVTDVNAWLEHLETMSNFYALRRDAHMETRTLEVMLCVLRLLPEACDNRVKVLSRLATTCLTMGRSNKTQNALANAESDVVDGKGSVQTRITLLLAKAEYSLAIEDSSSCEEALGQASQLATAEEEDSFIQQTFGASSSTLNIEGRRLVARAAYLHGAYSLENGNLATALRACTTAKCMLFKIWSSLEQNMPRDQSPATSTSPDGCPSSDTALAMEDVQPIVVTRSYSHLSTPQLRMLVPDLLQVAMLEIKIHSFRGAYHEAFAVLKHANKIANYVGAGAACLSDMMAADLFVRSLPISSLKTREEKVRDARTRIEMVDETFLHDAMTLDTLMFGSIKADILAAEVGPEEQLETLDATLTKLEAFVANSGSSSQPASSVQAADALAGQLSLMTLEKKNPPVKSARTTKAKTMASKAVKKTNKAKAAKPEETTRRSVEDAGEVLVNAWRGKLVRNKCTTALSYHSELDVERMSALIERANNMIVGTESSIHQSIAWSQFFVHQAAGQMAADIRFNALQDSIVSVPSPNQQELGLSNDVPASSVGRTPRKGKSTKSVAKVVPVQKPTFHPLLRKAFDAVYQTWQDAYRTSSSTKLRLHSQLLSNVSVMASGCRLETPFEMVHPLVLGYHNDLPSIRTQRLNRAVEDPAVEKLDKADLRSWPILDAQIPHGSGQRALDRSEFQHDFIDIIPSSWNVVSMSLTNDKTAMKLVRYRTGQSPFVFRIPFAHREADDPDEEVLDMALAYERLRAIIKQHEFTPAEAGVTDTADFKKKWWHRKHELDVELRLLLSDVEEHWFSAAKGIFSSHRANAQALSALEAQLQSILLQHCPTKREKGKAKSNLQSLKLEPCVLELFVGLGHPDAEVEVEGESDPVTVPLAESSAMAEGIHDLVRLILEGLQFAGESIAIDEVDMDNVIIKVIDALRDYHGSRLTQDATGHTVLILDDQLHGFPWESVPCLRHRSLSRLSSLADLRDRLLAARSSDWHDTQAGISISRLSGTSLVNPSGDLKKTAQRFQPWLTKLPPNWAHLRKAPDDEGWKDLLSDNELFLYVGHGSTSQYVRPRVVKRLGYNEPNEASGSTCAVSWLIGCGSVAVEDLGEFQPSGMVLSYLAAGSPAVLGALWDVGDIDADHFSITAGDYWGLWDESNKGLDPKLFPARKKISEEKKAVGRNLSMCEAVAKSRGGCKLPYLNGAAFVVYGIPVFLD